MPKIPIKFVISFSSQDAKHTVDNLVRGRGSWLCSPGDKSGKLQVDLQLEHSSSVTHIDLGNSGSMTVSVEVGRSSWPTSQAMVSLLPTVVLMSPQDMRQGKNKNTVRMFKQADLCSEKAKEKWDRVRIICSQPFKKTEQFGLAFLNLHTNEILPASNSSSHVNQPVNSSHNLPSYTTNISLQPSEAAEARKDALVSSMNLVELKKKTMTESLRSLEQSWMTVGEENGGGTASRLNVTGPVSRAARLILATKNIENKETAERSAASHKTSLECEALEFLISLNLTEQQINSMNVKGVRQQFESKKGKALDLEEKKIFKEIALDFACQRLERIEQQDAKNSLKATYEKNKVEKENTKNISPNNNILKESSKIQILPTKVQPIHIGNKKPMYIENKNCEERDLNSKNKNHDNKLPSPKVSSIHQNNEDTGKFKFKKLVKNEVKELTTNNPMSGSRNERAMSESKVSTPTRAEHKTAKKTPRAQKKIENTKECNLGKWINTKNSAEKMKPFTFSKVKPLENFESEIENIDLGNWSDDEVQDTSNRMSNGYIKDFSPAVTSTQGGVYIKNGSILKSNNVKKSFGSSSDESNSSSPWIQKKSSNSSISDSGHSIGGTPKDKFGFKLNPARYSPVALAQPSPNRKRLADTSPISSPNSKRKASGKDSPTIDLNECPICSGFFPVTEIESHAASCLQVLSSDNDSDSSIHDISPQKSTAKPKFQAMEECPICCTLIDAASIVNHASNCAASAFG